ncbi:hypothetical protein [Bailinhaonella thermotolerans]|uniref:Cysteine dioxygenase n=1 Tax=Bailinhaonella thermotolerans TaxID=1070861 RepID=A0A3A4AVV9_9ACTN|nr:hypothetical protein [Bailinhaonella thermotolerans]RJL32487.1 hypothetical protein D5H75_13215 [Bailinhaonella thermotolerans]
MPVPPAFAALHAELGHALDEAGDERVVSVVTAHGGRSAVRGLVEAVCGDEGLTARSARDSLAHPLGFDRFVLFTAPGYQLRLHVWWPGSRMREDVHDHRFGFASAVVTGSLQVSAYVVGEPGTPMARFEESRSPTGDAYVFRPAGTVPVREWTTTLLGPGSGYSMRAEALHRVSAVPAAGPVATLFVKLPPVRATTTVLTGRAALPAPSAPRRPFTPDALRARLHRVAAALA